MGGVRPLVSIMAQHSEARHWAALALLKLADNFNNHITIAEEGGIQALLQLEGLHPTPLHWKMICHHLSLK